jgi:hypothetical protein
MRLDVDLFELTANDWIQIAARLGGTVLTALLVAWIFHRARQSRARSDDLTDVQRLEYDLLLRWFFVVLVAASVGFLGLVFLFNPTGMDDPAKLIEPVACMVVLCLVGSMEAWLVRIELSEHGITSHSPWTGERRLAWGDITELAYDETWSWFVVRGMDGTKIYLNLLLKGLPSFSRAVRNHLDQQVYQQASTKLAR